MRWGGHYQLRKQEDIITEKDLYEVGSHHLVTPSGSEAGERDNLHTTSAFDLYPPRSVENTSTKLPLYIGRCHR